MAHFFIVCPLGLEKLLEAELSEIAPFILNKSMQPQTKDLISMEITKGGVLIECEIFFALQLHFFSKIASRILMRLGHFFADEFSWFEKELKKIDLKKHIESSSLSFKVSAQGCKLGQEKRLEEILKKVFLKNSSSLSSETYPVVNQSSGVTNKIEKQEKPQEQTAIYLRGIRNQFEVSLDLTGVHMHRRQSGRELKGLAPLRENLAAALVYFLRQDSSFADLKNVVLIDPMAGSGTLLSESNNLFNLLNHRDFAFESYKLTPEILKSKLFFKNYKHLSGNLTSRSDHGQIQWGHIVGFDQDLVQNQRIQAMVREWGYTENLSEPEAMLRFCQSGQKLRAWIVSNPPYGERLKAIPAQELLSIWLRYEPSRIGVIMPQNLVRELERHWPKPNEWVFKKLPVQNGGLPCYFFLAIREPGSLSRHF